MTENATLTAVAVARHVETLLPPLPEFLSAPDAASLPGAGLGPSVTVPAIYLHIIIKAFEGETLERQRKEMEDKIDSAALKPKSELDDDQITALAVHLAADAHRRSFEPQEAAMSLWKAAATIAVAHMPADTALNALDGIHAMTRADVAQAIGMGATKQ
ncbi:hypothetical protein HHL26_06530 [Sphingobium sp. TB-6]|uniref:hypothetical protein n=1 Tax=Sphingobium sp. TB-6 TaxID=2728850 RepID=UPI00146E35E1|nr:hypothetical protein [Sphingobium sp. TB-6]NML88722.1 hypothetical protein [Sphingobium sp. TB-6]